MTSAVDTVALSRSFCHVYSLYISPPDDSLYESPEPFLTDDTSGSGALALPRLSLLFATSLIFLAS